MQLTKIVVSTLLFASMAFGDGNVTIYSDYNKTVELAKKEKRPIFMLFTKEQCRWCKKLKSNLFENEEIAKILEEEYLVLYLDKEKSVYPQKYKVKSVPDLFLISETEEVYTEILGYRPKPKDYLKWFKYVRIERE